jgi:hypothetical protein
MSLNYVRTAMAHKMRKLREYSRVKAETFPYNLDLDARCSRRVDERIRGLAFGARMAIKSNNNDLGCGRITFGCAEIPGTAAKLNYVLGRTGDGRRFDQREHAEGPLVFAAFTTHTICPRGNEKMPGFWTSLETRNCARRQSRLHSSLTLGLWALEGREFRLLLMEFLIRSDLTCRGLFGRRLLSGSLCTGV